MPKTNEELVKWDKRCLEIAVMADRGDDKAYGPALARLARDIRQALATKDAACEERVKKVSTEKFIDGILAANRWLINNNHLIAGEKLNQVMLKALTPPLPDQLTNKE